MLRCTIGLEKYLVKFNNLRYQLSYSKLTHLPIGASASIIFITNLAARS